MSNRPADKPPVQTEAQAWGLNDLEYRFAQAWYSGTRPMIAAFEEAGGAGKSQARSAKQMRASRVFHSPKVQAFLKHLEDRKLVVVEQAQLQPKGRIAAEAVTNDRIKLEEACLAFYNPQELLDENGNFIPLHLLPEHVARCISEIEGITIDGDDGKKIQIIKKLKFWNKGDALRRLEQIQGMLKDPELNINFTLKALLMQIDGQSKGKLPIDVG